MTAEEIRLRCLELAMAQARAEQKNFDLNRVEEISTRFYNHVAGAVEEVTVTNRKSQRQKMDKTPAIFE